MPTSEPLRQFLQAARSVGIRVSAAEGIDAARAVQIVGYSDRAVLKDTLSLVLAKTPDEKHLFDECFDLYFRRDSLAQETEAATDPQTPITPGGFGGEGTGGGGGRTLSQMLLDDDRAALATAMEEAARDSGIQNIRFFTQKNLYARRILDRMGLRQVERDIEAKRKDDQEPQPIGWRTASRRCATRRATWSNAICCCSPAARRRSSARNC